MLFLTNLVISVTFLFILLFLTHFVIFLTNFVIFFQVMLFLANYAINFFLF